MNLGSSNLSKYEKNDLVEKLRERMSYKKIDGKGKRKKFYYFQ